MNPLLYKAHALQRLTVELLVDSASHTLGDYFHLILLYLVVNIPWTMLVRWAVFRTCGVRISYLNAFGPALLPLLFYVPMLMTILDDVLAHGFRMEERFILVFALFVAVQMLGALFGIGLKAPRSRRGIGLRGGIALSLFLLLLAIPYGLALLSLNLALKLI